MYCQNEDYNLTARIIYVLDYRYKMDEAITAIGHDKGDIYFKATGPCGGQYITLECPHCHARSEFTDK